MSFIFFIGGWDVLLQLYFAFLQTHVVIGDTLKVHFLIEIMNVLIIE